MCNQLSFLLRLAGLTVAWSATIACSASLPTAPEPTVAGLMIIAPSALNNVRTTGTHRLQAYSVNSDGVFLEVTTAARWESSNSSILRVTQTLTGVSIGGLGIAGGNVTGEATITASYQGRTDSIAVTVLPSSRPAPYLDLTISGAQPLALNTPATIRFRYFRIGASFQEVNGLVNVTTSDPSVATLDGNRLVPVSPGHFYILTSYEGVTERTLMFVGPSTQLQKP